MRAWLIVIASLVGGCGLTPVEVDVTFPREENFLYADFGQLLVYPVDPAEGLGDCPDLLDQVESTGIGMPVLSTDRLPICDFRSGGVSFGDVPPGPHAYLMLAYDDADNLLLDGCTIAEAYEGAPAVEVRLFPTSDYAGAIAGRTLTCGNANDKCTAGCR
ncbi:MAG: hypothetical protein H6719_22560 [Sandaracinaceae bacterium]|nr:hypothetical protein [Sandaracinaceae bacterium]